MKTKIFTVWTELLEKFLNDISSETVSHDDLITWIDTEGPKIYQGAQHEYHEKNKSKYLQGEDSYPPPARIDLAYEQIAYGFDKIFEKLISQFPLLNKDNTSNRYAAFKKDCLSENFLPFIAARAVITGLMVKANDPDRLNNLKSAIKAFENLKVASEKSIESMNEYLPKLQTTIPRGSSSPVMHKKPQVNLKESINDNTHDNEKIFQPK